MLTMMKFVVFTFVLLTLFLCKNLAFDIENYTVFIEELSRDEKFLDEYTKWSTELFSQRDYIYGDTHKQFSCSVNNSNDNNSIPISVHKLQPSDIKCIAAMGDSFTTGLGTRGITPMDLLFEDRGISWSIGGDYTYSTIRTLPNILRQFNPKLKGFSTKGYVMSQKRHIRNNRLNVAKSGDYSNNLLHQADLLIDELKNDAYCDLQNDWKLITIFIGKNDLCHFCEDSNSTKYTPDQYITNIRNTLDRLYNASIPRLFINLVLPSDIQTMRNLNSTNSICQTLLPRICPCAAFPTNEQEKILDDYITKYQQGLKNLIETGRYEEREDFTVVIQPFMTNITLPSKDNNTIDYSYFAPDCFHFSDKAHSQAALALWNNMLEPVGSKQLSWQYNQTLKCPTKDSPYLFTSKNSPKISNNISNITMNQTTTQTPTTSITMNNSNLDINQTSTSTTSTTSDRSPVLILDSTPSLKSLRISSEKSNSNASLSKSKFLVISGFLIIIAMILIVGVLRRRKYRSFPLRSGSDRNNFQYSNEDVYEDEVEIYSQPKKKTNFFDDNEIPKTHGTRMDFE